MYLKSYISLALLAKLSTASYVLKDDYGTGDSFFEKFSFFTETDPTDGFVDYVDRNTAQENGMISGSNNGTYMGVDHSNTVSGDGGRQSVRLTSSNSYNHGLVILDLNHMPGGVCGTWPAFWMVGSDWPDHGEIDIIEGVNDNSENSMALHTSDGCSIEDDGFSGTLSTSNCYVDASGQSNNAGCSIESSSTQSYGAGFNQNNGGVYATEWTSDAISIWFFPPDSIPSDVSAGTPNPTTWGTPSARYAGSCDIDSHFSSMNIVFDITFCGDWAGSSWSSSSCASKANTCDDYVSSNPSAFADAYWGINSLKVYQDGSSSKKRSAPSRSSRRHAIRHGLHGKGF